LWAKAVRLGWRRLFRIQSDAPIVLLFSDGGAGLLVGKDAARELILLKDPRSPPGDPPIPVDELRLLQNWEGLALLVRRARGASPDEEPFTLGWLSRLVLGERRNLREIVAASITLSVLQILPPFLVMVAIDRVIAWRTPAGHGAAGPEGEAYRKAGRNYAPRHALFQGVGERGDVRR